MMRRSLRTILQTFPNVHVVGEAITGEDAVVNAGTLQPNIVLMDVNIPVLDGITSHSPHQNEISVYCRDRTDLPYNRRPAGEEHDERRRV